MIDFVNLKRYGYTARKIAFVQEFLKLKNEEKITQLENILRTKEGTQFQPMSREEFNKRIDKSLSDSENDRVTEADDLLEEREKEFRYLVFKNYKTVSAI